MLLILFLGIGALLLATRSGDRDATKLVDGYSTQCLQCRKPYNPENSSAPGHYKYLFDSAACYHVAKAEGRAR
jgi:hypothetical protein